MRISECAGDGPIGVCGRFPKRPYEACTTSAVPRAGKWGDTILISACVRRKAMDGVDAVEAENRKDTAASHCPPQPRNLLAIMHRDNCFADTAAEPVRCRRPPYSGFVGSSTKLPSHSNAAGSFFQNRP